MRFSPTKSSSLTYSPDASGVLYCRGHVKRLIIIVSSDAQFLILLRHVVAQEGYDTQLALDCETALSGALASMPTALVLDCDVDSAINLSRAIRTDLRACGIAVIVIVDTAAADPYARCINAGIDAIFVRPVDPARLLDLLRTVVASPSRRTRGAISCRDDTGEIDIVLDPDGRHVSRKGRPIHLGLIEFNLLLCLLEHPERVMSRQELISAAWPNGVFVDARTVNVHVGRLRKALEGVADHQPIRTVRGVGYGLSIAGAGEGRKNADV